MVVAAGHETTSAPPSHTQTPDPTTRPCHDRFPTNTDARVLTAGQPGVLDTAVDFGRIWNGHARSQPEERNRRDDGMVEVVCCLFIRVRDVLQDQPVERGDQEPGEPAEFHGALFIGSFRGVAAPVLDGRAARKAFPTSDAASVGGRDRASDPTPRPARDTMAFLPSRFAHVESFRKVVSPGRRWRRREGWWCRP